MKNVVILLSLSLVLQSNVNVLSGQQQKAYDLANPDLKLTLPPLLMEVSGISWLDRDLLAVVQDEDGMLFLYDTKNNKIVSGKTFGLPGDYEGIAVKGKNLFVLRSDGTIFSIPDYTQQQLKTSSLRSSVPAPDNEGLCFDNKGNRLLIAPKGRINDENSKNKRFVYSYNLATGKPDGKPAFVIDLGEVKKFALANNPELVKKDKKGKPKEPDISMHASAIAIHPVTGKLYLISSSDRLLFVFGSQGLTERIYRLQPKLFPQPEGITFSPEGDMYISNEGSDGAATILRFNYR
ncbi:MAG: SdiA-regulated domain-containing protein [Bacteroidales bacterium]|nr:SdiA-regulated domain-containing protein [Bacteroidales bacterium]